jgi:cyclopropane fatty-acyl-phospholipid synthase-like methyltransferase
MATLEYGAGTGLLGRELVAELGAVTLADASTGMTDAAVRKIAEHPAAERLRAVRLDLMSDPVPTERYDLILSMMALHHVADVPGLLASFHTMLRSGGQVALVDLDHEDGSFHDGDFDGHHGFPRDTFGQWLASAGFDDIGFRTAYTLDKEVDGEERSYTLFLATARRP